GFRLPSTTSWSARPGRPGGRARLADCDFTRRMSVAGIDRDEASEHAAHYCRMFACDVFEITGDAHRATRIGDRHFVANVLCRVKDHLLQFTCEMVDCALRTIRTRLACS